MLNTPARMRTPTKRPQAFRYRQFELDDDLMLVVRCELDAALETKGGGKAYITTKVPFTADHLQCFATDSLWRLDRGTQCV